jgi:two-component system LytT family response regulator
MNNSATNESKSNLRFLYAFFIKHKCSILYCEAVGSYTLIHFSCHDPEKAAYRLHMIEEELNDEYFIRCHRSYIVNIFSIRSIVCRNKQLKLELASGEEIPVARDRKKLVKDLLNKKMGLIH